MGAIFNTAPSRNWHLLLNCIAMEFDVGGDEIADAGGRPIHAMSAIVGKHRGQGRPTSPISDIYGKFSL